MNVQEWPKIIYILAFSWINNESFNNKLLTVFARNDFKLIYYGHVYSLSCTNMNISTLSELLFKQILH